EGQRAQALAERVGDAAVALQAIHSQSVAAVRMGECAEAANLAQQALAAARALGDLQKQGSALTTLAIVRDMQGDKVGALRYSQQALTANQEARDRREEALGLGNVGEAYLNLGAFAEARPYLEDALARSRMLGFLRVDGSILEAMARLAWRE